MATTLKQDGFGTIEQSPDGLLVRNTGRAAFGRRWLARSLARREARALLALADIEGIPQLVNWDGRVLSREWLGGQTMREARPDEPAYFRNALHLLRRMHAAGVTHNDLAKENNCLVFADSRAGFIDFQLAVCTRNRGRLFRMLAHEDLRHLLKHKRYYCPDSLTNRQKRILANPALPSRLWMRYGKPVYHWWTRSMLGRADREGSRPGDT